MGRRHSETRELIERTALELFATKGIRETTIRDIASAAGIAEGTMYRHYENKADLAERLFLDNYAEVGRQLDEVQSACATAAEKIAAMVRYFLEAYERDSHMFTYLFLARHRQLLHPSARVFGAYTVIRRVIRDAMHKGEMPEQDPDVATSMALGVVLQVIDSRLLGGRIKQRVTALNDEVTGACLRVLQISARPARKKPGRTR